MSRKIELLAPGGDVEAIKAAIVAGANAVYCGLDVFNARNRAKNLSLDELNGILTLAHKYDCEVFLTLNIVVLEHEIKSLVKILNQLVNTSIDGIIVQDLALFNLVKKHFPSLDVHASTQLTTHNEGQIKFLSKLGASRVNLSRELNIEEVKELTSIAHQHDVLTEVFVHGSLCVAFSGQCYSTSVSVGNSANRGRCSQACRDEYQPTQTGNRFPLNLKDNSAYFDLPALVDAQVDSLKVEGRIKGAHYVYTVIDTWRKQINSFIDSGDLIADDSSLHKVFNRDFTNSFLTGDLTKEMFTDNPRDNSVDYAIAKNNATSAVQIQEVKEELTAEKDKIGATLKDKIQDLSIEKPSISMAFTAKADQPLTLTIHTNDGDLIAQSQSNLRVADQKSITQASLESRFKSFNNAHHTLSGFDFSLFDDGLSIPFKEITQLKDQAAFLLNGSKPVIKAKELPKLEQQPKVVASPKLSMLISDESDISLADITTADIYFKLPESFKKNCTKHIEILQNNPRLIPWFPAVLIGKDYHAAVKVLEEVKPTKIVTNNTGIAYKAYEMGIEWVAGPFMNTTNSYALMTLQEELNCAGAFISNEINYGQMRHITRPKNFKLFYSIYHPVLMMTSRQCFFQQTVGCKKPRITPGCMLKCEKATTIINAKGLSFAVDKQKGGYPSIYNHEPFLNTSVVTDLAHLFDEFFIDLTNIGAGSKKQQDKATLIGHFEQLINGNNESVEALNNLVPIATHQQYVQGL